MMKELLEMKKEYIGEVGSASDFKKDETAIVIVDMVNGFVHKGNMASPRVKAMAPNIASLLEKFKDSKKVFFKDCHTKNSREFKAYIEHCIDKEEIEIIDELRKYAYTETYEAGSHNAEIMNIVTLYSMKLAGIKIVDEIK